MKIMYTTKLKPWTLDNLNSYYLPVYLDGSLIALILLRYKCYIGN